jgi:hypothetical protein
MKGKINLKLIIGAAQSLIAFSAIILAALLNFKLFNIQNTFNLPPETQNFYTAMLIIFGFVLLTGGLFQLYEWWDTR